MMKFGKVRATRAEGGMFGGSFDVEIFVENIGNRNYVRATRVADTSPSVIIEPPHITGMYRGINPEKDEDMLKLLPHVGSSQVASFVWLEPLTEVK